MLLGISTSPKVDCKTVITIHLIRLRSQQFFVQSSTCFKTAELDIGLIEMFIKLFKVNRISVSLNVLNLISMFKGLND